MAAHRTAPPLDNALAQALGAANASFYDAFRKGDLRAMRAVWSERDDIACLHPGVAPLIGRRSVLQSWASILEGPAGITFRASHAAFIGDRGGVVTGVEILAETELAATNLFRLEDGVWRMVVHQGGAIARQSGVPEGAVVH
ncbi:MAG: nuclear transport factor 2 family protein [Azospirillaceae bacterium]